MGCDKSDAQVTPMLEGLKRNYAVVAVNYRLSWEAVFPALVQDAKAGGSLGAGQCAAISFRPGENCSLGRLGGRALILNAGHISWDTRTG